MRDTNNHFLAEDLVIRFFFSISFLLASFLALFASSAFWNSCRWRLDIMILPSSFSSLAMSCLSFLLAESRSAFVWGCFFALAVVFFAPLFLTALTGFTSSSLSSLSSSELLSASPLVCAGFSSCSSSWLISASDSSLSSWAGTLAVSLPERVLISRYLSGMYPSYSSSTKGDR